MNRKQRRAAQRHSKANPALAVQTASGMAVASVFAAAVRHHEAGRLAEAEDLYRKILAADPKHVGSLHHLGLIAVSVGRNDIAVDLIGRAIALDGGIPACHFNIGLALRALGRFDEVVAHAQRAIALKPDYVGAHMLVGDAFKSQGKPGEAAACFERALALDPRNAEAHNNLGTVLAMLGREDDAIASYQRALALDSRLAVAHANLGFARAAQGRLEEAIPSYLRAIALDPDRAEAHNNLAAALAAQGHLAEAAVHYEQALRLKPDFIAAYQNLATIHIAADDIPRALEVVTRALKVAETQECKTLFVHCLRNLRSGSDSEEFRGLIIRALSEPWGRPGDMADVCIALVKRDRIIADCIARAAAAWPARLPMCELFGPAGLSAVSGDRLLRAFMENARVTDIAMERFLTAARAALLAVAARADDVLNDDALRFCCALAQQCYINEYVFARTEDELVQAGALRRSIGEALRSGDAVPAPALAAVAAYFPLYTLPDCEALLALPWPEAVGELLVQQVREPIEERKLRAEIPRLTAIEDDVSLRVQRQYEENPYPRWVKAAPADKTISIDARLRGQFPLAPFRKLARTGDIDILVAGCGTGQQVVDVARRFAHARVLAIDLSLTSLCYAKYRTDALGLTNVAYGQADILKLESLGRMFDVIDSGGVLHHLGVPLAGWRALLNVLRPDGVMRLGFYSELARAEIVAAQRFIAERGHSHSAEDIRRCRQEILALDEHSPLRYVATFADFFSTSDCRDLLFHVQEHRLTLPQIKTFLAANGLEFLGFEIDARVLWRYSARFPHDSARIDLDCWHAFEQENPRTFAGMYQFWVQKRAGA